MADDFNYLMRQREAPLQGNRGADMAGMFLGGGNNPRAEQLRQQGMLSGARASDAMAQARERQQKEVAKANYAERMRRKGDPDSLNLADMAEAGLNPNEFAQAGANNQKAKILADAYTRATGKNPDRNTINLLLQVYEGKPADLTKVAGGVSYDPKVTPDQNTFTPTAVGAADISEKRAQAGSAGAAAGEHSALADLARARTKEVGEGSKTGKSLSREQVLGGFGTPDKNSVLQVDPQKYEDFLSYQKKNIANDPRYLDANYALINYKGGEASRQSGLAAMADPRSDVDPLGILDNDPAGPSIHTRGGSSTPPTPPAATPGDKGLHTLFAGQDTPSDANASTGTPAPSALDTKIKTARQVVRTGKTKDGRKVVQYDDGTTETAP